MIRRINDSEQFAQRLLMGGYLWIDRDCYRCGYPIDQDATAEDVERDEGGDPICCRCHEELFCFECHVCGEMQDKFNGCNDGSDVFVMEKSVQGFDPGFYLILERPYLLVPLVGDETIMSNRVKRLAPVPAGLITSDFECGPVCRDCQEQYLGRIHVSHKGAPS